MPFLLATEILLTVIVLGEAAHAQSLPPPTRNVYKCVVNGKVAYSDEPCLGAQRIDVEPTRGLNKSTGKEQVGRDIQRERQTELITEAIKPITGLTPLQLEAARRRARLAPEAKAECGRLDPEVANSEVAERSSSGDSKTRVQAKLFALRKRQRELGC